MKRGKEKLIGRIMDIPGAIAGGGAGKVGKDGINATWIPMSFLAPSLWFEGEELNFLNFKCKTFVRIRKCVCVTPGAVLT